MRLLRAVLIAVIIVLLAGSPALLRGSPFAASPGPTAHAAALVAGPLNGRSVAASNQNEANQKNANNNNNSNDNRDNNGNDNGGNSNSNHNGNDNGTSNTSPPPPPAPREAAPPPPPTCSIAGQDSTFTSPDGRVSVHVFPSMGQSIKITVLSPVDPAAVPPPPGQKVDALLFQVIAESCNGGAIPTLGSEVNLGVHYTDGDAAGLNETNFTLARLDTSANQWRPAQKQANDPANNFASATITDMGYYVLYQRS
jgi:hypothetical protein